MAQSLVVLSDSGLPLLWCVSSAASPPPLPFATIGLLSALHSSAAAAHCPLSFLLTSDARLTFGQRGHVVLLLTSHCTLRSTACSAQLLQRVQDGIVLLVGREALEQPTAVERLKRRLRACAALLRVYLSAAVADEAGAFLQLNVGLPEHALRPPLSSPWSPRLDALLTGLSTACSTQHVALYLGHRLLLPSSHFALLHPSDLLSLSMLLLSTEAAPSFGLHDCAVFLSHSLVHRRRVDGATAYRLLIARLSPTLSALLLCGPQPSTERAQLAIDRVWAEQQSGLADWEGTDDCEHAAVLDDRIGAWLLIVRGKKVVRGTRERRTTGSAWETREAEGDAWKLQDALALTEDDGVEETGVRECAERAAAWEQLVAFHHASIDALLRDEAGEAYAEADDALLCAVRSGEQILYARVERCVPVRDARRAAHAHLSALIGRRKQRSSVLLDSLPSPTAAASHR